MVTIFQLNGDYIPLIVIKVNFIHNQMDFTEWSSQLFL